MFLKTPFLVFFPLLYINDLFKMCDISIYTDDTTFSSLCDQASYGISIEVFSLISSFFSNRRLWLVTNGRPLQECLGNVGFSQGLILGPSILLFSCNIFICNIPIFVDEANLFI